MDKAKEELRSARIERIRMRMEAKGYMQTELTPMWQGGVKRLLDAYMAKDMAWIRAIRKGEA